MPDDVKLVELVERVMTEHWDMVACGCAFCCKARDLGLRPRACYPNMPSVSILEGSQNPVARMVGQEPPVYDWSNPCKHDRLTEEGICRNCGEDRRGT